jgi:hypothetical protein
MDMESSESNSWAIDENLFERISCAVGLPSRLGTRQESIRSLMPGAMDLARSTRSHSRARRSGKLVSFLMSVMAPIRRLIRNKIGMHGYSGSAPS